MLIKLDFYRKISLSYPGLSIYVTKNKCITCQYSGVRTNQLPRPPPSSCFSWCNVCVHKGRGRQCHCCYRWLVHESLCCLLPVTFKFASEYKNNIQLFLLLLQLFYHVFWHCRSSQMFGRYGTDLWFSRFMSNGEKKKISS